MGRLSPEVVDFRAGVVSVRHALRIMCSGEGWVTCDSRKAGGQGAQLVLELVVDDENSELGALCLALGLWQQQQLLFDVLLQLGHGVSDNVQSARDKGRSYARPTHCSVLRESSISSWQGSACEARTAQRHGTHDNEGPPSEQNLGSLWAAGTAHTQSQPSPRATSRRTHSHWVRTTSAPICSAVVPGSDS